MGSGLRHFYYHPRMLAYDFGQHHPLNPERLRRTVALLQHYGVESIDPGEGSVEDVLRVHSDEYVEAVREISQSLQTPNSKPQASSSHPPTPSPPSIHRGEGDHGFGPGDNPPFAGMYEASLAYVAGTARAAEAVRDGDHLAFGLAGGLHHAHRDRASGFCIFNDPAIAIHILRERFDKVAYVDIDVHHGDGVQWIYYDDPTVLTCSIHEDPRTLFPGTGFVEEAFGTPSPRWLVRGKGAGGGVNEMVGDGSEFHAVVNVPMEAGTTGDVWLWSFQMTIMRALEHFEAGAIVLQMGADSHFLDPLAHIRTTAQEWLEAVRMVRDLGAPIVAVGGGGYEITCVPRMWTAACLILGTNRPHSKSYVRGEQVGAEADVALPAEFFDERLPQPRDSGRAHAERVVRWLEENVLPSL